MNYTFKIQTDNKGAVTAIRQINQEVGGLNNRINSSAKEMSNSYNNSFDNIYKSAKRLFAGFAAFEGLKTFFNLGVVAQENKILFEGMSGSAEKGQALLNALQQYATVTKLTSTQVKEGAQYLFNYGDAYERILPDIKLLADASGGNAEKFRLMAYGFGQVIAAGRLMGQEARQLTDAGFNPLQEISRKTGESMLSLKRKMEAGLISADMVRKAFISATSAGGRFYQLQERLNKGVGGQWSNVVDKFQLRLIDLFNKLTPLLYEGIAAIDKLSNILLPVLEKAGMLLIKLINLFKELWPILKYVVDLLIIWAGLNLFNKLIVGVVQFIGYLQSMPALINSIGSGFNSWTVPIAMSLGLILSMIDNFQRITGKNIAAEEIRKLNMELAISQKKQSVLFDEMQKYSGVKRKAIEDQLNKESLKSKEIANNIVNLESIGVKGTFYRIKSIIESMFETTKPGSSNLGAGLAGGGNSPITDAAINTSLLSGASGGLGEAKVINMYFNSALVENNIPGGNGMDIMAKSPQAAELILRVLNNIAPSQGSTF